MTNPPAFEFEDGSPATPAKKEPGAAPAAAFNPFADQKVDLSPKALAPVEPPAASAGSAAPVAPVMPAGSPASVADDAGASRDLWTCPHCGSGNQKKRVTCRACGKDPAEPVKQPWFRTVPGMAGLAGAVLLVIIVLVMASRTDKSLHTPGPQGVDSTVRAWGKLAGDETEDLGEKRGFMKRGMLAVSGRVAGAKSLPGYPWITTVVLVLGAEAKDDLKMRSWVTNITDRDISCSSSNHVVLHCLFDDKPTLARGDWLSLKGSTGFIMQDASKVKATDKQGHFAVRVQESQMEPGAGKP